MKNFDEILAICEQLFYEHSINTVGVDLLSKVLNISKTTLYKKINSKNELIKLILEKRHKKYMESLQSYCGDNKDIETVKKIFDWYIKWVNSDKYKGCFFLKAMVELNNNPELFQVALFHKKELKKFIGKRLPLVTNQERMENFLFCSLEGIINLAFYQNFSAYELKQLRDYNLTILENNLLI